jgi:hypothetical protein
VFAHKDEQKYSQDESQGLLRQVETIHQLFQLAGWRQVPVFSLGIRVPEVMLPRMKPPLALTFPGMPQGRNPTA